MKFIFFLIAILNASLSMAAQLALNNTANEPFQLHTYLATTNKAPTIIALHGCGGMLNPKGEPNLRTQYKHEGHSYCATARLLDDGVIDPREA